LLRRGRERFRIYCAVCHGDDGYAHGIVVRRGFPAPPSLHDERLRDAPVGYVVQVITQGHGLMLSYADRVAPADRWAIAAFVRALQFSQHAPVNELAAEDRQRLGPP
jgi:mono/diheme cytochrome c family protein